MSEAFDSIRQVLEEAIEFSNGNNTDARVHRPSSPDVKAIRKRGGMNQNQFASTIGISLQTLKYWENGKRQPKGPVLVLLNIIDKAPDTVIDILAQQQAF